MKILCLSDIHLLDLRDCIKTEWLKEDLQKLEYDVVVITGDIVESISTLDPYKTLSHFFPNKPVICTLGNHEFPHKRVKQVLERYAKLYKPGFYNVHYLDIIGHYDIGDVRFLGNVLWYDGSMKTVNNQNVRSFAGWKWLDALILDFDFVEECEKCKKQIAENYDTSKTNILCVHTCPDYRLNVWWEEEPKSEFNAYSGVKNFLLDSNLDFEYVLCGHTHRRICKEINIFKCVNVGNDYQPPYLYQIIEV